MMRSIRARFTIIYFILVFVALIGAGLFIVNGFETTNLKKIERDLDATFVFLRPTLEGFEDLRANQGEMHKFLNEQKTIGIREEVYVVDNLSHRILATTQGVLGSDASDYLDYELLSKGFEGKRSQRIITKNDAKEPFRILDKVYPLFIDGEQVGVLYLSSNLSEMDASMRQTQNVILQAILLSVLFTVVVSFIIAKSVTDPINDITDKANKLAKGDFSQFVEVKSDDEIGKLSETYNFLTSELTRNISDLNNEKSKMETVINYMADGLIAIDTDGYIIHCNPKAMELLDLDVREVAEGQLNAGLEFFKEIVRTGDGDTGSVNVEMDENVIRINYAPYEDREEGKNGVVYVVQDITEDNKLEIMRREFVANVSHELKTPITSIKSYTETILSGMVDDPEMQQQFLEVVNSEADRMNRIVRDLLDLSNFDVKAMRFDFEYHDYVELLHKTIMKVQATANKRRQTISLSNDLEKLVGHFDYDRMEQVVLNILSNAIKYTPDEGDIYVDLHVVNDDAIIRIRDTGMGIPDEDVTRIFERFYRVDKARSREQGGTGLGLSIAKEIVDAHGGRIDVYSKVDEGTTVGIAIPLSEV